MVTACDLFGVEKLDEETKNIQQEGSRHLRKIRDEERAAEEILEDVKQRRQPLPRRTQKKRRSGCMDANIGYKQQYKGGEPGERLQ